MSLLGLPNEVLNRLINQIQRHAANQQGTPNRIRSRDDSRIVDVRPGGKDEGGIDQIIRDAILRDNDRLVQNSRNSLPQLPPGMAPGPMQLPPQMFPRPRSSTNRRS